VRGERGNIHKAIYLKENRSTSNESESNCNESSRISKLVSASSDDGVGLLRPLGVIESQAEEKDLRGVDGPVRCPEEAGRLRPKPKPKFKFWLESKRASRVSKAGKSGAPSTLLLLVTSRTGI